ncbi:P-loop containing nucleoside triphosphate hydrolase protein [Aspergillus terreus]|uniref:P-loop containing nucleoside triphosphate hydrolase protein n=1 Tax=Aspergillus terreus TaxID=33178 RepID=A0A5M3ZE50_ASPTE|nr:hypothetical protein ATETN484_0017012800 [Aspergillus terreus]GFF21799.1 P-loop containing nucleoside triphosphate hydrolase protein [Aspergillus terreus]
MGNTATNNQKICSHFAKRGFCRYNPCRFAHVRQNKNDARGPADRHDNFGRFGELAVWKQQVNSHRGDLGPLFAKARALIQTDEGTLQDVIQCLSTEHGLKRIQQLVQRDFDSLSTSAKRDLFVHQMLPFMEAITHPNALASLVMEQAVATIYNCLYGVGGRRAEPFLRFLATAVRLEIDSGGNAASAYLEQSLLVFWKIVELNSTAFIQEQLQPVAQLFADLFLTLHALGSSDSLHQSHDYLDKLQHRLNIGLSLPSATKTPKQPATQRPVAFVTQQASPGGRHDNDHADICRIQIMPTFQEVLSPRSEYLPVKDPRQWHVNGLAGLLDRNFRLLREDTIGQLRDAIHAELRPVKDKGSRSAKGQTRTHVYRGVVVQSLDFHRFEGPQFLIRFAQPKSIRNLPSQKRQEWWQLSKRLQSDALVCLVDPRGSATFCTVVSPDRQSPRPGADEKEHKKVVGSLSAQPNVASVVLQLVEPSESSWQYILDCHASQGNTSPISLVEFPGVLLPSFQPTLLALQGMQRAADVPMSEFLVPRDEETTSMLVDVPPPVYAAAHGFSFDLKCLMEDGSSLKVDSSGPVDLEGLQQGSTLDDAQASALVHSLRRKIGLIQGPPGTGKSYTGVALIKVLLANKATVRKGLGPIICVCYTNHALDQLLEDLLDHNITSQIIRIGSQSKSERLQPLNLRTVSRGVEKTRLERQSQWRLHEALDEHEEQFLRLRLNSTGSPHSVKYYLERHQLVHYRQLFEKDKDGFQRQTQGSPVNTIQSWLRGGKQSRAAARSVEELANVHVDMMTAPERKALYTYWVEEHRANTHVRAQAVFSAHMDTKASWDRIRDEMDLRCLRAADVIGVTTTGLARNLKMLRRLPSKVLVCEEAGEVLEAHMLTSLLPSLEQVVLIGDHQQLRPQIQNYDLSRESTAGRQYSLDTSLFERLVEPDDGVGVQIPFCTLETQRRMHPSISQLIRDTLYPRLQDAPSVLGYPEVTGMRKRLFWLDHRAPEGNASDEEAMAASHWNDHEIQLTVALVNHLLRQGTYQSGDIAVLTPYLGQLHRIRRKLSESFIITVGERDQEDLANAGFVDEPRLERPALSKSTLLHALRVATVDNFQGEEAKVVVISLVRSNSQNRCGFLRTPNRINVLLSRAQHGMYLIGNSATSRNVDMWGMVLDMLEREGNIGYALDLTCPRHPEAPITVSEPDHFAQYSPEGGCSLQCFIPLLIALSSANAFRMGVRILVQNLAGTHALRNAPYLFLTLIVFSHRNAMGMIHVHHVPHLVMCGAAIPSVRRSAPNRVLHAQSLNACPHAPTAHVPCHVLRLATMSHALCAVIKCYRVATSARRVKDTVVDFILGEQYRTVDLTENPCIFPECGHFLTIESMDGQMGIGNHYVLDDKGRPVSIASSSQPFSIDDIRKCAICRGSLRNVSRYGRLVRRALLDEATKRFILYLNQVYVPLAQDLPKRISQLQDHGPRARAEDIARRVFQAGVKIRLEGPQDHQVQLMSAHVSKHDKARWKEIIALREKIRNYRSSVEVNEQPFNRVRALVEDARRRKKTAGQFDFDSGVLQTKGHLQATALLLRLDTALLADFLSLHRLVRPVTHLVELHVNLTEYKRESQRLVTTAESSRRILQQAEGNIFLAQFCALERQNLSEPARAETLLQEGTAAIEEAERLCDLHTGQTRGLQEEIEGTRAMLRGSEFYTPVTNEERMAVLAAMSREFRGTGHWYYCENGHPFTIGECGGAMELSRCPECGAAVGGQDHRTATGVTHARDLETALQDLHL